MSNSLYPNVQLRGFFLHKMWGRILWKSTNDRNYDAVAGTIFIISVFKEANRNFHRLSLDEGKNPAKLTTFSIFKKLLLGL